MTSRDVARGVAGAAALIAVLTLLARLAGFGRTLVFTNTVGGFLRKHIKQRQNKPTMQSLKEWEASCCLWVKDGQAQIWRRLCSCPWYWLSAYVWVH